MKANLVVASFLMLFSALGAEVNYDIQDIGTTQTRSSQAIALNNQGQILGSYNIDGSKEGKHFFVRDRDGTFHEIPSKDAGITIDWRFLTEDGRVYGDFKSGTYTTLFMWDGKSSVVNFGNLPGKEVSAINNAGQVLIKSVSFSENGKSFSRPVIWQNGCITILKGLGGDLGIESEESYGLAMNNKGEVVGLSLAYLSYKNELYKQTHAVKWVNGKIVDLHNLVPKSDISYAIAINDLGELLIKSENGYLFFIDSNGVCRQDSMALYKLNNLGYAYCDDHIKDKKGSCVNHISTLDQKIKQNAGSIWLNVLKINSVNGRGEIVATGKTIYGEQHAMFLTPVKLK